MRSMNKYIKIILLSLLFVVVVVPVSVKEAHSLRLILHRVVFEDAKRSEVLILINGSDEAETYRLMWSKLVMTPDGGLKRPEPGEETPNIKPVDQMVKFAPRRITLAPRSSQQVRLILRTPADLEDGEYRSHLWIRREVEVKEFNAKLPKNRRKEKTSEISITMLPGITIPVIVRKGNLDVSVKFEGVEASSEGDFVDVSLSLLREGQRSSYGDIDYICNPGNDEYVLKSVRGVAVYTEINRKNFKKRFKKPEDTGACNNLLVQYMATDGYLGDVVETLAETTVPVR